MSESPTLVKCSQRGAFGKFCCSARSYIIHYVSGLSTQGRRPSCPLGAKWSFWAIQVCNGQRIVAQRITEGRQALRWTGVSCHHIVANQVRWALFVPTHNLSNFLRPLALPESVRNWQLGMGSRSHLELEEGC